MEPVGARVLVNDALHHLVPLDLHDLLVPPLMQPRQLARPSVDLRLRGRVPCSNVASALFPVTAQTPCSLWVQAFRQAPDH